MDENCKEKVAFVCRYGTFLFEVMLFGLMNLQTTFQKMIEMIAFPESRQCTMLC